MQLFDPEQVPTLVMLPNGEQASTTCISMDKLLKAVKFQRPVTQLTWMNVRFIKELPYLEKSNCNLKQMLEYVPLIKTSDCHVLVAMDTFGASICLMAIGTSNDTYLKLLQEEYINDIAYRYDGGDFSYSLATPVGEPVYVALDLSLRSKATHKDVDINDVLIRFKNKAFCELYGLELDKPYSLVEALTIETDFNVMDRIHQFTNADEFSMTDVTDDELKLNVRYNTTLLISKTNYGWITNPTHSKAKDAVCAHVIEAFRLKDMLKNAK